MTGLRFDAEKFGRAVRMKRTVARLSLRELCSELPGEVSPSTLSRIEAGRPPDCDTLIILCAWMGSDLFTFATTKE